MAMDKKLFIFDVGGVVVFHAYPIEEFAKIYSLDYKAIRQDWISYIKPMLDGFLDVDCFYKMLELNYDVDLKGNPIMVTYYHPEENKPVKDIVKKLRASGHKVVTGSNTFAPHWNFLLDMKPSPLDGFDGLYASHEMHLSKPSPAFYRYIAKAEGFDEKDCFFFDDSEVNVDAARSVGMRAFHYTEDNEALLNYLKPYISE